MKKCTLCVDRIHDERLPEHERQPACVLACPTHARHFGDFEDPESKVSQLTAERGGFGLLGHSATSRSTATCRRASRRRKSTATPRKRAEAPAGGALARLASLARARDRPLGAT